MKQLKNEAESLQSCVSVSVTDLRIGNYYIYDDNAIKLDGSLLATYLQNATDLYLYTIPLTEEWMGNFGFKLFPWGFVLNAFRIDCNPIPLTFRYMSDNRSIEIKYVHQLQNLYYALTGSELHIGNLTEH